MSSRASKIDYDTASDMLADGRTVLDIAHHFRVSPQSVYDAIRRGRIQRPAPDGSVA